MSTRWEPADLSRFRVSYESGQLLESDLRPTPLAQFMVWFQEAVEAPLPEPNAMVLGTVDAGGEPSSRMVLLKGVDAAGFRFFTNYTSRKALAMASHPFVTLLFPWFPLHRQVTVWGVAERMAAAENAAYFRSRPRASRLAAWASRQSEPLPDRSTLDERMAHLSRRWPEGVEIPCPDFWGGYLVRAHSVEFWHGRASRLHDRLRFTAPPPHAPLDGPGAWQVGRYAP